MTPNLSIVGRIVRKGGRGMTEGLVYVEAYLPFDPEAFGDFQTAVKLHGNAVKAAAAEPELARKALDPIDTHGEAMLPGDLLELAHGFLTRSSKMDVGHDEQARTSIAVVESFVNTPEIASPHFFPGAWVVVVKVEPGSDEWAAIEAGELDAVSFQATVLKVPVTVKIQEGSS